MMRDGRYFASLVQRLVRTSDGPAICLDQSVWTSAPAFRLF
ncbi:MAG TPA: hypothetical protein VGB17_12710 [Pyrinomonadaceae bacterium]